MLRVAALQLDYPQGESFDHRVERVSHYVGGSPPADLLVLPELWDAPYFAFDDYRAIARPLADGPIARLRPIAAELGTVVVAGSVLENEHGNLFNTSVVIDADGSILGTYRKRHLFAHRSKEAELLTPGDRQTVVSTSVGNLGIATCFDLRFPEQFTAMRDADADLFVVPAAWPAVRAAHWRVLVQARAIENQTPVIAVNGVGQCCGLELAGSTLVADAYGTLTSDGGKAAGWISGEIDMAATKRWRRDFPMRGAVVTAPAT